MEHHPHPVDVHVGARIRARRKQLGMSQTALATALGVTFQQVQKYERGSNRVSASRLYDMSRLLQVSILDFFEGLSDEKAAGGASPPADTRKLTDLMLTPEGVELAAEFPQIRDGGQRRAIVGLVKSLNRSA